MASKKETVLRGAKLMKKAIAAGGGGALSAPDPVASGVVRKLKLPNGEGISPAMKELFLVDASWLGIEWDEDEAEIEGVSLEEVVEEHFGEEAVAAFAEAYEMLDGDCVLFSGETSRPSCLYVGEPDGAGKEYPVLSLTWSDGVGRVGGFVPFDVWAAQELGALERGKGIGDVPPEYAALPTELAEANGDGRVVFQPKAGEGSASDDDDEDEEGESEGDDESE